MKKAIWILAIIVVGVGIYFGYYALQRKLINMRLELMVAECNPVPYEKTPELIQLKKQVCAIVEEENKQFKQAARESRTDREFRNRALVLIEQWDKEDKVGHLIEAYKRHKEQPEQRK